MHTIYIRSAWNIELLVIYLFVVLGYNIHGDESPDPEPVSKSVAPLSIDAESFTLMDVEAMGTYRDDRHAKIAEDLAKFDLSVQHQDLITNALTKTYVGIPLCSFTHTEPTDSLEDGLREESRIWNIVVDGHVQSQNEPRHVRGLDELSPFPQFSTVSIKPETGKLIDETDTIATFLFDSFSLMDNNEFDEPFFGELAKQMRWVFEFTVDKAKQEPKLLVFKLANTVRKRFLFKLTKFELAMHFSYIDSCGLYAMNKMNGEFVGSVLILGRIHETMESVFTDISCEQPMQFLLPEDNNTSIFLQF